MSAILNNPAFPQVKVLVMSMLSAMAAAAIDVLKDDGADWRTALISLAVGALTGIVGYRVPETNPSHSAIETVRQRGL